MAHAEVVGDPARRGGAQRAADADGESDRPERKIEMPRPGCHVAHDERHEDAESSARIGSRRNPMISTSRRPYRSANRPTAGEASATMIWGSTIQAPISKLGLVPRAER